MRQLAPVLVGLSLILAFSMEAKSGFSGIYTVSGTNPGVGAYKGTLTVVPKGDVYHVEWIVGNVRYDGIGVALGDTLSVAYTAGDRSWMGVVAYRQDGNGTLEGRWAVYGGPTKFGTERAVRK
jgi:hypothetical protein